MGGYAIFTTWREWHRQLRAVVLVFVGFLPVPDPGPGAEPHRHRLASPSSRSPPRNRSTPSASGTAAHAAHRRHALHRRSGGARAPRSTRSTSRSSWSAATSGSWPPPSGCGSAGVIAPLAAARHDASCSRPATSSSGAAGSPAGSPTSPGRCTSSRCSCRCASSSRPRSIALWRQRRRGLLIVLVCVIAVATVPFLYDKSAMNHRLSEAQVPWQRAPTTLPGKSLVIVRDSGPYLLHLNPFSQNATRSRRPGAVRGRPGGGIVRAASTATPTAPPTSSAPASPRLDDAIHHPDAVTADRDDAAGEGRRAVPAVTLTVTRPQPANAPAGRRRRSTIGDRVGAAVVATVGGG